VLGCVARDYPRVVPRIAAAGHEIGCHGMHHDLVHASAPPAFEAQIADARKLLADQSGQPVWGFRAPSWSVTPGSLWALDALTASGYRYDSSIFPARNYLYGVRGAPRTPYMIQTRNDRLLVEVPPTVIGGERWAMGVGGGFSLRLLPLWVHRRAMRACARRRVPFLAYLHPRELDPASWHLRLPLSAKESFIHRFRLRAVPGKRAPRQAGGEWTALGELLHRNGVLA
jgi:polysaccharide deacetylase family protein (PEP-CTERM system associated)